MKRDYLTVRNRFFIAVAVFIFFSLTFTVKTKTKGLRNDSPSKAKLVIQNGHSSYVTCLAASPDGRYLASGSDDKSIKVWTLDGRLIQNLTGHLSTVRSIAFSQDSRLILSGSDDRTVRLWKIGAGISKIFTGHSGSVSGVAFSHDGSLMASASTDKTLKLWSSGGGHVATLKGHDKGVRSVSFNPIKHVIASSSDDGSIKLWSYDGKITKTITGHDGAVSDVTFTPDGNYLISAGAWDMSVKIWDHRGVLIRNIKENSNFINSISCSPDGKYFASTGNGIVNIWNINGKLDRTIKGHNKIVYDSVFIRGGRFIATCSHDSTIKIWNRKGAQYNTLEGHSFCINDISMSKEGSNIAVATDASSVLLWNTGKKLLKNLKGHKGPVFSVEFSPDDELIATASHDNTVRIWTNEGKPVKSLKGHKSPVYSVSFSRAGNLIASGELYGAIRIWKRDGTIVKTFGQNSRSNQLLTLCFSPDGKHIISGINNMINIWSVNGRLVSSINAHSYPVNSIACSPDGKYIASASYDRKVKLWTIKGIHKKTFNLHLSSVNSVAFDPSSKHILTGSYDKTIKICSIDDGLVTKTFQGHSGHVNSAIFSPDGKKILSGSSDTTVKVWDLNSAKCLTTLIGFNEKSGILFTPDGRFDYNHTAAKQYVAYVWEERLVDLNDIFDNYFTPGLFKKIIADRLEKPETGEIFDLFKNPPAIKLSYPSAGTEQETLDDEEGMVVFKVKDSGGGVDRAEVRVNGKLRWKSGGDTDFSRSIKVSMPLGEGINNITITAYNKMGGPVTEHVYINRKVEKAEKKSKLYILAVGNDEYSGAHKLDYAVKDAVVMLKKLEAGAKSTGFFKEVVPKLLKNAAKKQIKDRIKDIAKNGRIDDVVILYFSGHGLSVRAKNRKKLFAFLPVDYPWRGDEETALKRYGIRGDWLASQVKEMDPQKVVLIFDCCQSGDVQVAFHGARAVGTSNGEMMERLAVGTGIFIMASSAGSELSREDNTIGHGLFTYVLLQGLREKKRSDTNRDGVVTVKELSRFVDGAFEEESRRLMGKKYTQSPVVNSMGRDEMSARVLDFPLLK